MIIFTVGYKYYFDFQMEHLRIERLEDVNFEKQKCEVLKEKCSKGSKKVSFDVPVVRTLDKDVKAKCKKFSLNVPSGVKKIKMDVGTHLDPVRPNNDEEFVIAFEPKLDYAMKNNQLHKNLKVIPTAVSVYNGVAKFNVGGGGGSYSHSLNDFTKNIKEKWLTDVVLVPVLRLDSVLPCIPENFEITYLEVDAQGEDFNVILSAGEYLKRIQKIKLEVTVKKGAYYSKASNTRENIIPYMTQMGFKEVFSNCNGVSREVWLKDKKNSLKKEEILNVFIVPNSHCDAGWLKTTEEYYDIVVKNILTNTINLLIRDKNAKFMWVETIFFSKWWSEQDDYIKKKFKELLFKTKQIEFVLGGWVMNDDACPTYSSIIDQISLGNQWLHKEFGIIPRIGWQIDPFGLSSVMAGIYKRMGFKYHVIARIDYQLKNRLRENKQMEFIWRTSKNSNKTDIFTHILYDSYCTFSPVDWEGSYPWGYNPRNSPPLTPENIKKQSEIYAEKIRERAKAYKTNNYLHTYGCDFTFREPQRMFGNMTLMIDYINENRSKFKMNLKFSLLSDYFEAIEKETSWPKRNEQDFFPYKDNDKSYWTGYFTSYPVLKKLTRLLESSLKSSQILSVASNIDMKRNNKNDFARILIGQQNNGEMQHHDGITGTAKTHVRQNYNRKLISGLRNQFFVVKESLESLLSIKENSRVPIIGLPTKRIHFNENENRHDIVLFNSLGWKRNEMFSFFTNIKNIQIVDFSQKVIESESIKRENGYEIFFEITLPPIGFMSYKLKRMGNSKKLSFHLPVHRNLEFRYQVYKPFNGGGQKSGVYIFRPDHDIPLDLGNPSRKQYSGSLVNEETLEFPTKITHVTRIFKKFKYLDLEIKGKQPLVMDNELILKIKTSIKNKREIYTDNNGLEMKLRKFKHDSPEPVAGNYYPIVYSAYINDSSSYFTLLTDKTLAGGSIKKEGEIELMLLRRTNYDDGRGVGEILDDDSLLNSKFRIFYDSNMKDASANRHYQNYLFNYPLEFFQIEPNQSLQFKKYYSFLKNEFPRNVNVMSLKQIENKLFLTLNHIYEKEENSDFSKGIWIELKNIFKFKIDKIFQKSITNLENFGRTNSLIFLELNEMKSFEIEIEN
eukprot:gene459-6870_t